MEDQDHSRRGGQKLRIQNLKGITKNYDMSNILEYYSDSGTKIGGGGREGSKLSISGNYHTSRPNDMRLHT